MENCNNICGLGAKVCTFHCVAVVFGRFFRRETGVALARVRFGLGDVPSGFLGISSFSAFNGASV